mmetsp:Transcript_15218/g.20094  ORF Transcript_15218/g.20094 Transcript_15218/m.20094 type:complete len:646 (+) Transcript_15218:68-2005(+)
MHSKINFYYIFLLLFGIKTSGAFYLPGVAPKNFKNGEKVDLKVNKLTSHETQLPYNYYYLPFCEPKGGAQYYAENLGEFLSGDRIESSPYLLYMKQDESCKALCKIVPNKAGAKNFKQLISEGYHHNWIVDNLPAASIVENDLYTSTSYTQGFPVGYQMDGVVFVNNHVKIIIDFHSVQTTDPELSRIVGFEVEPLSVKHEFMDPKAAWDGDLSTLPPLATCSSKGPLDAEAIAEPQVVEVDTPVLFTYDIIWRSSDTHWASRWDVYLSMDNAIPNKVHWFSIINSLLIVLFLSMMIGMILVRNLYRDIAHYNRVATDEERADDREETGWKLLHADVFRPPSKMTLMYCVFMGTGVQLLVMTFFTIIFATLGFLSPANRGSLLIAILLLFVTLASSAGYTSAVMYKTFKGKKWQKCTLMTAFFYPGICFILFFFLNAVTAHLHSTQAVPIFSMVALVVLWFGISVPMVFLGAYFGYRKPAMEFPTVTSNIPRQVPDQPWYLSTWFTTLIGGILPFGACFVELFFILSSVWMGQYYYVFGFLFLVYIILLVTCGEITMVLTYFQLCSENYHWWWRSFFTSGSTAIYVFVYSAVYFNNLEANFFVTYLLYFGYTWIICLGLFMMAGCVGVFSSLWLNKKIYASVKVD